MEIHNRRIVRCIGTSLQWRNDVALESALWAVNLVAVFFVTRYLFGVNSGAIYWGWDPQSLRAFLAERHTFSSILFGVGSDPIIGLGNISFPLNPRWFFSYTLGASSVGTIEDGPLSFAIGATALFGSTVACGRLTGFGLARSLAAGWLITLTTWQLYGWPKIITIWFFYPHHAEALSVAALTACAALRIGDGTRRQSALWAGAVFLGISYILFATGTSLILAIPVIGIFAAARLILCSSRSERLTIIVCSAVIGIIALALYGRYFAGLISYTAAAQFPDLSKRVPTAFSGEISLLLWQPLSFDMSSIFTPERLMLGVALIGALSALTVGSTKQRQLALGLVSGQIIFLTIGATNYWFNYWVGPSIWYFELYLFPFYVLCVCYVMTLPCILIARWSPWPLRHIRLGSEMIAAVALPIAVMLYTPTMAQSARIAASQGAFVLASPYPQAESAITRILKKEIALAPTRPFYGRVANLTGAVFPKQREWQRYSLVHYFAQFATGNLHDGPGLWQDYVSTVMEYNTLMSPYYFAFMRTFLTNPDDIVTRNIVGTRHINLRILALIGTRFIVTDVPVPGARLRSQITIPTPIKFREMLMFSDVDIESFELYLYELDGVNVGQFSPTEVKVAKDANEVLTQLSDTTLALNDTIVVTEPVPLELTAAKLEAFIVERDGYRIRASSQGNSILLLPIEFSRCWTISKQRPGAHARLFRADLLLTGLLFERQLDAEITFHTGPFNQPGCRLADLADSKAITLRNAFQDRPAFGVLGYR